MIQFSCPQCGKQYNLQPEFAGRKTTCAECKQPLDVVRGMKSLSELAASHVYRGPPQEFWRKYDAGEFKGK